MSTNKDPQSEDVAVEPSFLQNNSPEPTTEPNTVSEKVVEKAEFTRIRNSNIDDKGTTLNIDLSAQFGSQQNYQVSVNELPLNDFLHHILGELLQVSYLIEPKVKANTAPVTLELKNKVSAQRLFLLTQQILDQNKITIALNDDVFYVHPAIPAGDKSNIAFGYGRNETDVPTVSSDIIQLVPLKYGNTSGATSIISSLVAARISVDNSQGLIRLSGKRQSIIRGLSLINLLDSVNLRNKSIALLDFSYIDSKTFIEKITELLAQEGISNSSQSYSTVIKFIPIEHLGKVVVFASSDEIIDRVEFWTQQLDKPATGSEQSFFTYNPLYARASDLGSSLAPLIATNSGRSFANQKQTSADDNRQNQQKNSVQAIQGDNIRLVVDERSNSLIFYSTGKFYQELLPVIRTLDIMPKQVILEVIIAEVKLTGSYAKGVEFAIQNGRSGDRTESFAFSSDGGFGYSVVGLNGNFNINLNQTDGLINVLSRPTLLVRDGVSASINVGDDIPTVGSTTTDPINGERQTTAIQYRTTGINLEVTPTINAQGTVIMTISQNISNISPDGLNIGGSPSIFERKLSTEVVAGDGQTVMLGGLISENKSTNKSAIPLLGDIPLLGHLFRSDSESNDRTELIVLVTPRIIDNIDQWQGIQQGFMQALENISF